MGSPLKPHIITTYAELKTMRNDLTAHYKLGGNIDASASWEEGEAELRRSTTGRRGAPHRNPLHRLGARGGCYDPVHRQPGWGRVYDQ